MSCPKCGSGAVFQGKCRECGTVVDRRASSQAVARAPSLGDEELAEDTVADPRARRPAADATMAPPGRRPAASLVPDEDDDPERTRMHAEVVRKGPPAASAATEPPPPPAPPPPRPARASQQHPAPPPARPKRAEPEEPPRPIEVKDRSSWYREAGLEPPTKQAAPRAELGADSGSGENSVSITAPSPVGGYASPAAILFALSGAGLLGIVFGLSPISLVAGGVALVAAVLLYKGLSAGKIVAWLTVGLFLAWGGALAVSFKQPVLAALNVVPTLCLVGAMLLDVKPVRAVLGGVGVAVALGAILVPMMTARKAGAGADPADGEVADTTAYQDAAAGVSLKMPPSVSVWSKRKDIEKNLPDPWRSAGLKLGFATDDDSFVGGMLQTKQPPGAELRNLLAPISQGALGPPRQNDKLLPDGLSDLEREGWELSTRAGDLLVVVARTPDGRAFTLFGVTGTAKARNTQLFKTVAEGFQVKKYLRIE